MDKPKEKNTKIADRIVVIKAVKENKDGSMDVEFEPTKEFNIMVAHELKKPLEELTNDDISKYFTSILEKAAAKQDGYDFQSLKQTDKNQ